MRTASTFALRPLRRLGLACALMLSSGALLEGSVPAPLTGRIELPVRLVTLSDGTPRFGVPLVIDGHEVEAGLDTGSTGLRVMARALSGSRPGLTLRDYVNGSDGTVRYGYGSGTVLSGPEQTASVAFGQAKTLVLIQRVETVACANNQPRCPASRNNDPATFGIQGDGLPNEGFAAILGVNLRPSHQPNAFEAIGARRWIVELPVPGHSATGRILLNPTAAEMTDYHTVRFDDDANSVPGCIGGERSVGTICGPATIDSGAPGLRVVQGTGHAPVPPGTPVTIQIGSDKSAVAWQVATEQRDQGSHLSFEQRGDVRSPRLFLGVAPYYRFSILYDADAHTIGFKPR